jgi:hypothetical protein
MLREGSAWYGVKARPSLADRLTLARKPPPGEWCRWQLGCGGDAVGWSRAKINGVLVPACVDHEGRR